MAGFVRPPTPLDVMPSIAMLCLLSLGLGLTLGEDAVAVGTAARIDLPFAGGGGGFGVDGGAGSVTHTKAFACLWVLVGRLVAVAGLAGALDGVSLTSVCHEPSLHVWPEPLCPWPFPSSHACSPFCSS